MVMHKESGWKIKKEKNEEYVKNYLIPEGQVTWNFRKERKRGRGDRDSTLKNNRGKNFPDLGKELNVDIHETKRIPPYLMRPTPRHVAVKLSKRTFNILI